MKKRKQRVTWVTMGPAPHWATCERCKQIIQPPVLPLPVNAFTKYCEYVMELHRFCEFPPRPKIPEEAKS
jgi:hypothetical protein